MSIMEDINDYEEFGVYDLRTLLGLGKTLTRASKIGLLYLDIETDLTELKNEEGEPRFRSPRVLEHLIQGHLYEKPLIGDRFFRNYREKRIPIEVSEDIYHAISEAKVATIDGTTYIPFHGIHSDVKGIDLEGRILGFISVEGKLSERDRKLLCIYANAVGAELNHRYVRKAREQEKRALLERMVRVTKVVIHDVRNKLMALSGYTSLLKRFVIPDTKPYEYLEKLAKSFKKVEEELIYAQKKFSGEDPRKSPLDIVHLVNEIISYRTETMPERPVYNHVGSAPYVATVDHPAIRLVINELITNAHKYSPPNEMIRVEAERDEGSITFRITNSDSTQRDETFNPDHVHGTGVGLEYVRETIVDQHGGTFELRKQNELVTVEIKIPAI
jgi:signal transduction histidine kinase